MGSKRHHHVISQAQPGAESTMAHREAIASGWLWSKGVTNTGSPTV